MESSNFKNKFKKFFTSKNVAITACCIACPMIGIVYGTTVLIKNNMNKKSKNNNNLKNQNDENEKLKPD